MRGVLHNFLKLLRVDASSSPSAKHRTGRLGLPLALRCKQTAQRIFDGDAAAICAGDPDYLVGEIHLLPAQRNNFLRTQSAKQAQDREPGIFTCRGNSAAISVSFNCRGIGVGAGRRAVSGTASVAAGAIPSWPCSIGSHEC